MQKFNIIGWCKYLTDSDSEISTVDLTLHFPGSLLVTAHTVQYKLSYFSDKVGKAGNSYSAFLLVFVQHTNDNEDDCRN